VKAAQQLGDLASARSTPDLAESKGFALGRGSCIPGVLYVRRGDGWMYLLPRGCTVLESGLARRLDELSRHIRVTALVRLVWESPRR